MSARELLIERARGVLERWRHDPVQMVVDEWPQVELDDFQVELLRAFPHKPKIAMKSAKGPGKTLGLAMCGLNFLVTRPGQVKVGATSITGDNLDMNLWPEFHKWIQESEFFRTALVWSKTAVRDRQRPENRFIERRTWPKRGNAEEQSDALAGLHGEHVMWLIDESGGIPVAVLVTAEAIFATAGQEAHLLTAGNPTDPGGALHHACVISRGQYHVITITGDPDNPKRSKRISLEHARGELEKYGRDNPWVRVNILGEFPETAINALLGLEDVESAMARHYHPERFTYVQKRLGVDVARFGGDRTVIFPRQGVMAFRPIIMRHQRSDQIAARVLMASNRWRQKPDEEILALIDNTFHWGQGVCDQLTAIGSPHIGVNYAGKATDPRFKNVRAEMWIKGAAAIKKGAALPHIPEMVRELTEPTYTLVGGQFVLEDKDQIKERLGFSPDLADGYMTTYAIEDIPVGVHALLQRRSHAKTEFDPYAATNEDGGHADTDFDPYNPEL